MTLNYSVGILGSMDISSFKAGINQIKKDLGEVDTDTKKTGNSLSKFSKSLKGGLNAIKNLSTAAAGGLALIGLAAPSLSGAMSRIKTESFKLAEIFGRNLQPAFEWFANSFQSFNGWLDSHPMFTKMASNVLLTLGSLGLLKGAIGILKMAFGGLLIKVGKFLGINSMFSRLGTVMLESLKGVGGKIITFFSGLWTTISGFLVTTLGGALATFLAGIGGGYLSQKLTNALGITSETGKGSFETTKRVGSSILGGAGVGALVGAGIGAIGGPIGVGAGAGIGAVGGLLYGAGKEAYNWYNDSGAYSSQEKNTSVPITNNIFIDGQQVAKQSSMFQNQNMSYMSGGGQ